MLHQPSGGANGMAADIAIVAEEIIKTRARLNDLYAHHTGQVSASCFLVFVFVFLMCLYFLAVAPRQSLPICVRKAFVLRCAPLWYYLPCISKYQKIRNRKIFVFCFSFLEFVRGIMSCILNTQTTSSTKH